MATFALSFITFFSDSGNLLLAKAIGRSFSKTDSPPKFWVIASAVCSRVGFLILLFAAS